MQLLPWIAAVINQSQDVAINAQEKMIVGFLSTESQTVEL